MMIDKILFILGLMCIFIAVSIEQDLRAMFMFGAFGIVSMIVGALNMREDLE